jgi:hypothetical protein
VELRGITSHKFSQLREIGLINMSIEFRQRFFLPADNPDKALDVLKQLLVRYPIVTPEVTNPQEIPLPTTEFRALAQAQSTNIFDLLQTPAIAVTQLAQFNETHTTVVTQLLRPDETDDTLLPMAHSNEPDTQPHEIFFARNSPQQTFWDLAA